MEYIIKRSKRKTVSIKIVNGQICVSAPYSAGDKAIQEIIQRNEQRINDMLKCYDEVDEAITCEQVRELAEEAVKVIPERVAYYADIIGVTYGRITVRNQKSRWGSCSSKGNLNFNCLLMLAPVQVLDSVIVHELCHRKHMDHSAAFYAQVQKVYPEYRKWHDWLKTEGQKLLIRMEKGKQKTR